MNWSSLTHRQILAWGFFQVLGVGIQYLCLNIRGFLGAQMVKSLPAMQEIQVQSLGQEDSPGEGNGYPLQYSCLENPMDRGAWWATVHGVTKGQTQLRD